MLEIGDTAMNKIQSLLSGSLNKVTFRDKRYVQSRKKLRRTFTKIMWHPIVEILDCLAQPCSMQM